MREIVGIFTHKELLEAMGLEPPRDRGKDEKLRAAIIASANEAKAIQKRLDKEVRLLVIDRLLRRELALPVEHRPVRAGTIIGVKRDRVYVALDAFAIDLKVYARDLEVQFETSFTFETHAATGGGIVLRVGDSATLRVDSWDTTRRRFVLHLTAESDG
jgi:ribonuclease R